MKKYFCRFLLFSATTCLASSVMAQDSTNIFFDNGGPEFGITTPLRASFSFMGSNWSGGIVATAANPPLYASGQFSYEVPNGPATVTFDDPVTDVRFFYVHGGGFPAGTATAMAADSTILDTADSNLATVFADQANFMEFDTAEPISSINFSGGVIDNFSYTVAATPTPFDFAISEGAWLNPDTNGEGILFDFGPSLNLVFMAWFTFTLQAVEPVDPPPMEIGFDGQRWMTALLTLDGSTATGPLRAREGGSFDMPPTADEMSFVVGDVTVEFLACDLARVDYNITAANVTGSFEIQPLEQVVNPNGFSCGTPASN